MKASTGTADRIGMLGMVASVLAFTLIYAVCYTLIKAGLAYAPPLGFGGLRALIGGLALLGLLATMRTSLLPPRGAWPWILALAAFSTTIGFGAMFLSPGRTGAGIASVLGNTQPLFAIVLAALFLNERVTRGKYLALALGLAGVALISLPSLAGPDAYGIAGPMLALAASGSAAAGSVIAKRMGAGHNLPELVSVAAWQLIVGSLPLLAASVSLEGGAQIRWNAGFVALLLFLALVGTSFATVLWYWLLGRAEVGRLTLFLFLVPVVGLGIAVLAFGESLGLLTAMGAALTVAGIVAIVREGPRKATPHDGRQPALERNSRSPERSEGEGTDDEWGESGAPSESAPGAERETAR